MVRGFDLRDSGLYRNIIPHRLLDAQNDIAILLGSFLEGFNVFRFTVGVNGKCRYGLNRKFIAQNRLGFINAVVARRQVLKTELAIRSGDDFFIAFYDDRALRRFPTKLKFRIRQGDLTHQRAAVRTYNRVTEFVFLLSAFAHLLKVDFIIGVDDGKNRKFGLLNADEVIFRSIADHRLFPNEGDVVALVFGG